MPIDKKRRAKWVAAGYSDVMGSAWTCCPPPKEFIRVYHITSAKHALDDVERGQLKVARFSELNDPFELMGANLRRRAAWTVVTAYRNDYNNRTGLLCFSANWTSPVLWSHYGEKNHGICLGFNIRRAVIERVDYQKDRLYRPDQLPALTEKAKKVLRCTKSAHWRYEEEWRKFVPLSETVAAGALNFYPFDPDLELKEVILGFQCDLSLEQLRPLVQTRYPSAITYRARLAVGSFAIVPE